MGRHVQWQARACDEGNRDDKGYHEGKRNNRGHHNRVDGETSKGYCRARSLCVGQGQFAVLSRKDGPQLAMQLKHERYTVVWLSRNLDRVIREGICLLLFTAYALAVLGFRRLIGSTMSGQPHVASAGFPRG